MLNSVLVNTMTVTIKTEGKKLSLKCNIFYTLCGLKFLLSNIITVKPSSENSVSDFGGERRENPEHFKSPKSQTAKSTK